jgi:hypothetical protein
MHLQVSVNAIRACVFARVSCSLSWVLDMEANRAHVARACLQTSWVGAITHCTGTSDQRSWYTCQELDL